MKNSFPVIAILSALMVGCGGSSHNSSKSSLSSASSVPAVSSTAISSSQASSAAVLLTGVLLDAAVSNIGYRTATQQGFTNANGEFTYRPGELITFFIGNLELPAVMAGAIITPMNIANTNSLTDNQLINILRLLQSLDKDGDATNGIEITAAAIAAGTVLDFTLAPEIFAQLPAVQTLLQAAGSVNTQLVSTEQAVAHFQSTLEFINGPTSSSSAQSSQIIVASSSVANTSAANSSEAIVAPGSSANSSADSSATSSAGISTADLRAAKIEGFAAYANVTGGAGGNIIQVSTGTQLNAALCTARATKTTPIIIMVDGTINHANTTAQGCNTQADVIEIKQMSNVSIIGVGSNALFDEIGIHVRDASNIVIQNVHVRNVKKSGSPTSNGGDAIGLETDVNGVWIDHNWLEASGGEKDGYDSLIDMKSGVTNVTVSYNKFNDSSRAGLVGFNDSDTNNNITFHHNWYKNIEQRTPLIRNALVHVYNNYWSNESLTYMIHAINSRANAKVLVEGNYFYNVNNPLIASTDSPTPGCWQTNNENTVLPSIYYSRTVENGGAHAIPAVVNGQLQSNCAVSVPYTVELDHSSTVPAIVMANAGVGKITGNSGTSSSTGFNSSSLTTTSAGNSSSMHSASQGSESSRGGSEASSSTVSSSSSAIVIINTSLPLLEDFNNVVDANGFFSTAYKALATKEAAFYHSISGTTSFANGAMIFGGARLSLGNTTAATATTGADMVTTGEFDLSQPYRISFCVKAAQGTGALQVLIDNNTTGSTNSIHAGSSRIFSAAASSLTTGQRVVINSNLGHATSFIALRTESTAQVTIDNLWIGYQADTTSEPTDESCALSIASSSTSSVSSSEASSSVVSSGASEGSASSASSIASSESSSAASVGNSVVLSMNFATLGTTGLVENTETTLSTEVDAPTVTNTTGYAVKLIGKLKISTTQASPSGTDGSTGVVQFGNNASAFGKVVIKQVQCPFTLLVKHAPSSTGDVSRKLRITVAGSEVYYEGNGGFQTASVTPICSGMVDVEAYGWDGILGKGVRIFDLSITQ